jgi:putative exosortase-associated protein (TIGR04073 family)
MKHFGTLKAILFLAIAGATLSLTATADAYRPTTQRKFGRGAYSLYQSPQDKLGRGVHNVMFGWAEVPGQIHKTDIAKGPAAGVSLGAVKGVTSGIGRTLVGIFETVTFLIPNKHGYGPILEQPEFLGEKWHDQIIPIFDHDK